MNSRTLGFAVLSLAISNSALAQTTTIEVADHFGEIARQEELAKSCAAYGEISQRLPDNADRPSWFRVMGEISAGTGASWTVVSRTKNEIFKTLSGNLLGALQGSGLEHALAKELALELADGRIDAAKIGWNGILNSEGARSAFRVRFGEFAHAFIDLANASATERQVLLERAVKKYGKPLAEITRLSKDEKVLAFDGIAQKLVSEIVEHATKKAKLVRDAGLPVARYLSSITLRQVAFRTLRESGGVRKLAATALRAIPKTSALGKLVPVVLPFVTAIDAGSVALLLSQEYYVEPHLAKELPGYMSLPSSEFCKPGVVPVHVHRHLPILVERLNTAESDQGRADAMSEFISTLSSKGLSQPALPEESGAPFRRSASPR